MALIENGHFKVQGVEIPIYKTDNGIALYIGQYHHDTKEVFIDLENFRKKTELPLKLAKHEHSVEEWWGLENGLPAFKVRLSVARVSIFGEIDVERGQLALEFAGCEISHSPFAGMLYLNTSVSAARTRDAKAVRVRSTQKIKADVGRKFINGGYYLA